MLCSVHVLRLFGHLLTYPYVTLDYLYRHLIDSEKKLLEKRELVETLLEVQRLLKNNLRSNRI